MPESLGSGGSNQYSFVMRPMLAALVIATGVAGCETPIDPGPTILAPQIILPSTIGADDSHVFVGTGCLCVEPGSDPSLLVRISTTGGPVEELPMISMSGAYDMVLDAERVYWSDPDGLIEWMTKGGTKSDVIFAGGAVKRLAVDDENLYWADFRGAIERIAKDDLLNGGDQAGFSSVQLATGREPIDLAVDSTHVYFADRGIDAVDGEIARVPIEGGEVEPLVEHQDGLAELVVDDKYVYFSVHGHEVRKVPKGGGAPTVVADEIDGTFDLALDEGNLYVGTPATLLRIALEDGSVDVMQDRSDAYAIAVGRERVFWIRRDISGDLRSLPK